MRGTGGRLAVLIGGSALAMGGWGAVLPYLYGDVAQARGLGGLAAAGTFTAFAVGSLLTAPLAGRLADTRPPARVAAGARLLMLVGIVALALGRSVGQIWGAAALAGAGFAAAQPAVQVLLLEWSPPSRRREVFAWQFIANNVAIAIGGLAGGFLVSLDSPTGALPVYGIATVAALASAAVVAGVGRRARVAPAAVVGAQVEPAVAAAGVRVRDILAMPALRLLLVLTVLVTLACYAQFDAGLPAYALSTLHVTPALLGVGIAVNCVLVSVLTAPVVRATQHQDGPALLARCATIWIGCWLLLAVPMVVSVGPGALLVAGLAAFAVGETMLAPVLAPLAARLAPEGSAGRALGAVTGAQTAANAVGPALSGALLALHLPGGFIVLQVLCCLASVALARRLGRALRGPQRALPAAPMALPAAAR